MKNINELNEWDMIEVVLYNNDRANGVVDYVDKKQQLIHLKSANLWCGRINETFENLRHITIDIDDITDMKVLESTEAEGLKRVLDSLQEFYRDGMRKYSRYNDELGALCEDGCSSCFLHKITSITSLSCEEVVAYYSYMHNITNDKIDYIVNEHTCPYGYEKSFPPKDKCMDCKAHERYCQGYVSVVTKLNKALYK